jgi:hypothetical protein
MINLKQQLINDPRLLNVYCFGSHVYGSADYNSDEDYICIVKEMFDPINVSVHIYTIESFQSLINLHDITALECLFLKPEFKLKEQHQFSFVLDKFKLRTSISTIASNSWVKGKKKITVMGDYDLRLGIKSVFHSLRILHFGIQIGHSNKIIDYSAANYILTDMWKLSKDFTYNELWSEIEIKYRKLYNNLSSEFKQLCPKNLEELSKKEVIKRILENHEVYTIDLLNDLLIELK